VKYSFATPRSSKRDVGTRLPGLSEVVLLSDTIVKYGQECVYPVSREFSSNLPLSSLLED
jgi:hypothetical protein